jgi:hypothetical protein
MLTTVMLVRFYSQQKVIDILFFGFSFVPQMVSSQKVIDST